MKLRCGKNWIQKINLEQCRKLAQLGSTFANGNDETSYASENKIFACDLLNRDVFRLRYSAAPQQFKQA